MTARSKENLPVELPERAVEFNPDTIRPQWHHPLLVNNRKDRNITKKELEAFAYHYYLRFLPLFRSQPEGSLATGVVIEFTRRMRQKLGLAFLFEHKIRLNEKYFSSDPSLLPYTLFHELIHLWLYDCFVDPGHTRRFYNKMAEFEKTGLPVDATVHIHARVAPEGKYIYTCPNCSNRWYLRSKLRYTIFCGHCHDKYGKEFYAVHHKSKDDQHAPALNRPSSVSRQDGTI